MRAYIYHLSIGLCCDGWCQPTVPNPLVPPFPPFPSCLTMAGTNKTKKCDVTEKGSCRQVYSNIDLFRVTQSSKGQYLLPELNSWSEIRNVLINGFRNTDMIQHEEYLNPRRWEVSLKFQFCYYAVGNVTIYIYMNFIGHYFTELKFRLVLDFLNISLLAYMIIYTCSYIIMHNDIYSVSLTILCIFLSCR